MNTALALKLNFFIIWIQPICWMLIYSAKTSRFDKYISTICIISIIVALVSLIIPGAYIGTADISKSTPLFVMYSTLGLIFATVLIHICEWHAPQALATSVICIYISSFLWEVPYLIRNAFITGFETDWILHLFGLFFVWFIHKGPGWTTESDLMPFLLAMSLATSIFVMMFRPIPLDVYDAAAWNSAPYLFNRIVSAVAVFLMLETNNQNRNEWRQKINC